MKPIERLQMIRRIRLNMSDIKPAKESKKFIEPNPCGEEGYVAYGTKIKDGVEVPNCIPDPEQMKKIIKEGFPIPSPSGNEDEQSYVSRCMKEIGGEYEQEQALAICYSKWREK